MKSKKLDKTLRLSKSTVSTLNEQVMQDVKGYGIKTWTACKTCGDECTVYTWVSCIPRYCDFL